MNFADIFVTYYDLKGVNILIAFLCSANDFLYLNFKVENDRIETIILILMFRAL